MISEAVSQEKQQFRAESFARQSDPKFIRLLLTFFFVFSCVFILLFAPLNSLEKKIPFHFFFLDHLFFIYKMAQFSSLVLIFLFFSFII